MIGFIPSHQIIVSQITVPNYSIPFWLGSHNIPLFGLLKFQIPTIRGLRLQRRSHVGLGLQKVLPPDAKPQPEKLVDNSQKLGELGETKALFRHLNFQKWSGAEVLCTFWLGHVLRATTACNFSSLIWPAGSAPTALASLLFDPPEPQTIGKT